ncbi:hypothetical protein QR680_007402 [Steinernema hermaphroditum]|uniref:Uncharacterized protein n=1 Tax=Steinernema hermaphroditum TaxID=289476 RepID=A0AA39IF96_9BILA|nr:hypothetical protein QR680_007402 [Steinernema hermaphroditum]
MNFQIRNQFQTRRLWARGSNSSDLEETESVPCMAMDCVPQDFHAKVAIHQANEPPRPLRTVNGWQGAANPFVQNRKFFEIHVTFLLDANGTLFDDMRFALDIREMNDVHQRTIQTMNSFEQLKNAYDERVMKFRVLGINCMRDHRDQSDMLHTNFEEIVEFMTARLDFRSCLSIFSPDPLRNGIIERLAQKVNIPACLTFKRLLLKNKTMDVDIGLSELVLHYQVDYNPHLVQLCFEGEACWTDETEETVKKYVNRDGHKLLSSKYLIGEPFDFYMHKWWYDPSFELTLKLRRGFVEELYLLYFLHILHWDSHSYWYGRIHPNEKACVIVNAQVKPDGSESFAIRFCQDRNAVSAYVRSILARECGDREHCYICRPSALRQPPPVQAVAVNDVFCGDPQLELFPDNVMVYEYQEVVMGGQ